ncbi:MAG: hypothetical protein Q7S95_00130 [bacterium]|nr:hypothetical protein [bacterium]
MPPAESLLAIVRAILYAVTCMYEYLRLTYPITHTERYFDFRPTDALLLNLLMFPFICIGIPVVVALLAVGVIPVGHATFAAVALFLLPPALTLGFMELLLLYSKCTRP